MKLIIPSALAAALVSPASASCANRGNSAASRIMDTNDCFPPPTGSASSDSNACSDLSVAERICKIYIGQKYDTWCEYSGVSQREMKHKCWNEVQLLDEGKQKDLGSTGFASAEGLVDVALVASYFVCSLTRPSPSRRPEDSGAEEEANCECEGNIDFNSRFNLVPFRSAPLYFYFAHPHPHPLLSFSLGG